MEKTNGLKRSETWNKIYDIVKTLPREKVSGDAPDALSVTTSIEQLFLKLLAINDVSNRRELLIDLLTSLEKGGGNRFVSKEWIADNYLQGN
jgi:hypothetical protein